MGWVLQGHDDLLSAVILGGGLLSMERRLRPSTGNVDLAPFPFSPWEVPPLLKYFVLLRTFFFFKNQNFFVWNFSATAVM